MKKTVFALVSGLVLLVGLFMTGCDEGGSPTKRGGGGLMQSYDSSTGRYN